MSELSASIPADRSMIKSLIRKLNSDIPDDQRTASGEIYILTERNTENFVAFGNAGAFPLLARLLTSPDPLTQEHAMAALLNLTIYEAGKSDSRGSLISAGAVPGIVHVLKKGSMEAREKAASTIFLLSDTDENKVTIGSAGAIPPLVLLLTEGTQRRKQIANSALINLCEDHGNKGRAVRAGLVPKLTELLTEPDGLLKDGVLFNLVLLSSHPEGRLAIGEAEAEPLLVEIMGTGSPYNKKIAASVLVEVYPQDQKYLLEAQQHGAMGKHREIDFFKHGMFTEKEKLDQVLEKLSGLGYPIDELLSPNPISR
ncbi:hypothetical protein L2E82_29724 [Cichorium intybus]|uniref:Uncharacterized protein n=1 Tax=Cichorium intybus TaxID=13427 RepID=A0ACB9CYJ1_CICIN|nr:hypothetical protein L2E82_29724 [Cichorium intybus]